MKDISFEYNGNAIISIVSKTEAIKYTQKLLDESYQGLKEEMLVLGNSYRVEVHSEIVGRHAPKSKRAAKLLSGYEYTLSKLKDYDDVLIHHPYSGPRDVTAWLVEQDGKCFIKYEKI